MTESKAKGKANKIANNTRRKWNDLQKKISFCMEHNFEIEAKVLQKQAAAIYDILLEIEVEFEIK